MPDDKKNEATTTATPHAVDDVFTKLKTHFETKKVDEWQKKWLAVPANRKKYEKLADAPEVVGEEAVAITNDIIDFIQGQEAGQSHLFKRLKGSFQTFFKHPVEPAKKEAAPAKPAAAGKPANGEKTKSATASKPANGEKAKPNGKTKKPDSKPTKK